MGYNELMATLQNYVQNYQDDPSSFREVFKTCYSHGLESIYKLENVDLKSVRKLSQFTPEEKPKVSLEQEEWHALQLELDLGSFYRGWQVPYVDQEPIQVLQLVKPIERSLLGFGVKTIGALKQANLHALKLGQGHIEDVQDKLKTYLLGKPIKKAASIDFLSLVKCLFGDKEKIKAYVTLQPFGLHEWIFLTPSESMEIKRSPLSVKREWVYETENALKIEQEKIRHYFQEIISTWISPWIHARGGIATRDELNEYLNLRSQDPLVAEKTLELLSFMDLYSSLIDLGDCLTSSKEDEANYQEILSIAKSYFISPYAEYALDELGALILKELVLKWNSSPLQTVIRILKTSSYFEVFRNRLGSWQVRLNYCKQFD